jgi:hypothetical protein
MLYNLFWGGIGRGVCRFVMTSFLVVVLYPGDPAQVAAGNNCICNAQNSLYIFESASVRLVRFLVDIGVLKFVKLSL